VTDEAVRARRERGVLAAPSACPEAGELLGHVVIAEGVAGACLMTPDQAVSVAAGLPDAVVAEVRAVDSGEAIRARRRAADELTALTEELSLYDDGGEPRG
jgi:hypothetical protein